ncbi:MAG: endonuclease/exonuclease/phosphatase family protein [Ornithinimicrobium sp.]
MNSQARGDGADPVAVRVASYNLRALADDPEAAARVVRAIGPDVLLLQEIPRGPRSAYRMAAFARQCEMNWPGRSRRLSGTSLLVGHRIEVLSRVDRPLPVEFLGNPRTYSCALVRIDDACDAVVVSIHLPLIAEQRRQHVGQILAELMIRRAYEGVAWVIGGDLNEAAGSPAWQQLNQHVPLVSSPSRPTFPAAAPHRAIDAIFALATGGAGTARPARDVQPAHRGLVQPLSSDLKAATDHLPVWVDLTV